MIFVYRFRTDKHGARIEPPSSWRSLARAATAKALSQGSGHTFDDSIYAHGHVRAALEELFRFKCAYCESPLEETDWNVEHFRPKGRVAENRTHPGYYWLAYAWENLLPSCIPCNQRRRDKPVWGGLTVGRTGGKADQFPLEAERTRVYNPPRKTSTSRALVEHVRSERSLLIDPCWDTPSWYISFDPSGQIFAVDDCQYGDCTINVFNLERRRLRRKREVKVRECVEALDIIGGLKASGRKADAAKMSSWYKRNLAGNGVAYSAIALAVYKSPSRFGVQT